MLNLVCAFVFFLLSSALLVWAAVSDWREMHIANRISEALLGVYVLGVLVPHDIFHGITLMGGLLAGGVVLLLTLFLYAVRAMGGGDTKLASATALLVGLNHLGLFLVIMAVTGGLLGVYALMIRTHPHWLPERLLQPQLPQAWLSQLKNGAGKVPYGLAIATGGIVTLALKWIAPVLVS